MPPWAWIVVGVMGVAAGYALWTFNRLVALRKRAEAAWSDIDVQLKRRWDLVPPLVETVKGYARHESEALERVVAARTRATQAGSVAERGASEATLAGAVGRLIAVSEAYPDLKANASFLDLQKTLVDVEDHLQYARRYYNAVVRDLNTLVEGFPSGLIASATGSGVRAFFQLDSEAERQAPRVSLDAEGSSA